MVLLGARHERKVAPRLRAWKTVGEGVLESDERAEGRTVGKSTGTAE
jgi:hypothetical protein